MSAPAVDAFHSESFRDGLDIITEAVTADPQSPERDRRIANECTRALMSRLRVDDWLRSHPDVEDGAVARPVFVIGMPRTGTTVLVNLIGARPRFVPGDVELGGRPAHSASRTRASPR